jgi:hypothetical protein
MKNFKLSRQNTYGDLERIFSEANSKEFVFETNDFGQILFHKIIENWIESLGDLVTRKVELKEPKEELEQQYTKYTLLGGSSLTLLVNPNIKDTSEENYAEYFNLKQEL